MAVVGYILIPGGNSFVPSGVGNLFLQVVAVGNLQLNLQEDAERAQCDLRCIQFA